MDEKNDLILKIAGEALAKMSPRTQVHVLRTVTQRWAQRGLRITAEDVDYSGLSDEGKALAEMTLTLQLDMVTNIAEAFEHVVNLIDRYVSVEDMLIGNAVANLHDADGNSIDPDQLRAATDKIRDQFTVEEVVANLAAVVNKLREELNMEPCSNPFCTVHVDPDLN